MNKIKDMNDPRRQRIKPMTRGIKKKLGTINSVSLCSSLHDLTWVILDHEKIFPEKKKTRLQLPRVAWLAIRETGSLEAIQGLGGWWKYPGTVMRDAFIVVLLMAGIRLTS